ncbi:hypothetical protein BGW38_004336 [Lunasporangiospora selenospora]|uniref:Uncharacterized protein n=1 Tax=Lunasporangiospora selenospora TaxID=979761 RepID=A0A9P6G041_9FUNG|nr:hypothetical protein BGW38_004336 [Lunasporangiospora selenospora]
MQLTSRNSMAKAAMLGLAIATTGGFMRPASANIDFDPITVQLTNPGQKMTVTWRYLTVPPKNQTLNTEPFRLVLRALSGQVHEIMDMVPQTLLRYEIPIPATATGGKHSVYCYYAGPNAPKAVSTNQFNITGDVIDTATTPVATSTSAASGTSTSPRSTQTATDRNSNDSSKSSGGLSGAALGGIIAGVVQRPNDFEQRNPNGRNPFEGPEDSMEMSPPHPGPMNSLGATASLSPRQQHQQYPPPRPQPQSPVQHSRPFEPDTRESFLSEPESAYDPNRPPLTHAVYPGAPVPVLRNNSSSGMMHQQYQNGPGAPNSPSLRSMNSQSRLRGMNSPPLAHPSPLQNNSTVVNPFHDRETAAAGAGAAAAAAATGSGNHSRTGSPALSPRMLANKSLDPNLRPGTPKSREIEMQPLDVQQHQYEQQQKALQRQQQQRHVQGQQQGGTTYTPPPPPPQSTLANNMLAPTAAHPFNPMQYDDKAEIDEDGAPVYNGYRDTIFGAYAQPPSEGDDDEDSDIDSSRMPPVPSPRIQQQQQQPAPLSTVSSDKSQENVVGVQRKKSVKFNEAPASIPAQSQHQQKQNRGDNYPESDYSEDEVELTSPNGDDDAVIKRLMQTESALAPVIASSPSLSNKPPGINTQSPVTAPALNTNLSPVQSLDRNLSPTKSPLSATSGFGNGFYEDVLAAVDRSASMKGYGGNAATSGVEQEVFGAPSPRMTPTAASLAPAPATGHHGLPSPTSPTYQQRHQVQYTPPSLSPLAPGKENSHYQQQQSQHHHPLYQQKNQAPVRDAEEDAFYDASLL